MQKAKPVILIIDDDEDVLLTAKMILRSQFTILTLSSPKQLEKVIREKNPEVVILDMNFKAGATSGNEGLFWLR
ncbi:MAG: sigma-54-dependent Fis family transcriptional regulator, partial [Fulvivirga sp.]|nr:sigma-54-dependent Fis family transcriptional regulator [Fulvivirga sp.]